jgi:phenylalanyl-tRNA synthetase beta chain
LLSHYGVAREVAAFYSKPLRPIAPTPSEAAERADAVAKVEIADPELCHRYVALVFRNLKVQPSPGWLSQRLEACGVTSINNIVDVTNYVLLELGHPTHAFDLDTLADRRIIVRPARTGERLTTLDGVARELQPHHLVIADVSRPVALAGIMGGADTEISGRTKNVLLESAWFDPIPTRRAAKEFGLRTEASYRFERGMDVEAPLLAARRCAELFLQLADGELLAGALDVYPTRWRTPELSLRSSEILRVLGASMAEDVVERILTALGFAVSRTTPGHWQVCVPSWRRDVAREVDLIEELARQYGYDKFPSRLPPARQPVVPRSHANPEAMLRKHLEALGYHEAISFALVDPHLAEPFLPPGRELARLSNPLSEEVSVLRPTGLVSMAETLAWNVNRGQRNVRFYEIGKAYGVENGTLVERRVLTLGATGLVREKTVHEPVQPVDFFALKGAVEGALEPFAREGLEFRPSDDRAFEAERATVFAAGKQLGRLGQLASALAGQLKLRQRVFLAELDLEAVYASGLQQARYRPLSRFPSVERDFSLLLEAKATFGRVREVIERLGIPEVVGIAALDRFRGQPVPAGHYSLLVRVTFQSSDETLTDAQVEGFSARIVRALQGQLDASLRT